MYRYLKPRNLLPNDLKSETSYLKFKDSVKPWCGPKCGCNAYKFLDNF